ncbi:tetratricopeptide repeat protein [Thalassotalea euphylliae]|nr:hypothetical protein [Thalassotalea euphylliae]
MITTFVLLTGCKITPLEPSRDKHQQATNSVPMNALSDQRLAEIARQSGDLKTSARLFSKLLASEPTNAEYALALAQTYRQAKQAQLAINVLTPFVNVELSPRLLPELSPAPEQADISSDDKAQAERKSELSHHESQLLWQTLGLAYLDLQAYPAAQQALQQAVNLAESVATQSPAQKQQLAQSYNGLGVAASWLQGYDVAEQQFRQALQLTPNQPGYISNLALNHMLQQQYQQGANLLYPLYRQGQSSAKMRQHLALALVKLDKVGQAQQVLAVDLTPDEIAQNIKYFEQVKAGASTNTNALVPRLVTPVEELNE